VPQAAAGRASRAPQPLQPEPGVPPCDMADKAYQVLARKWRPQRFDDVVGQDHVSRTLKNAIVSGRIHHAFLFIGSRGIGKTTSARILAKALNCLNSDTPTPEPCGECDNCRAIAEGNSIDVIEIDGASNNGVDNVREIRENIRMVPSNSRYKVYIIDEVHQLSVGAFNALLKTLEEPPAHAVFVLATTESHKIPATIISRCQRYDFRRVAVPKIVELLSAILEAEGRSAAPEALQAIARASEGGVRDAESILDELMTYSDGEITLADVVDVLGMVDWRVLQSLCDAILRQDIARQLVLIEEIVAGGKDLGQFVEDLLRYFRNLLVSKTANAADLLHLPDEELEELNKMAGQFSLRTLISLVEQFSALVNGYDSQIAQRIALESLLIKLSKMGVDMTVDTVLEKIMQLGAGGLTGPAGPAATPIPAAPSAAPPDPPKAGGASRAPAAPAPPRRMTVDAGSLPDFWARFMEHVQEANLVLASKLGQCRPTALDGDGITLAFPADREAVRLEVEQASNREAILQFLEATTENVRRFETVAQAPAQDVRRDQGNGSRPAPPPPVSGVDPETGKRVAAYPGVAEALRVFRGTIVRVNAPAVPEIDVADEASSGSESSSEEASS